MNNKRTQNQAHLSPLANNDKKQKLIDNNTQIVPLLKINAIRGSGNRRIGHHFGFTTEEFIELSEYFGLPDEWKAGAKAHYNGSAITNLELFNTKSTITMLSSISSDYSDVFRVYFKEPDIMAQLLPLFREETVVEQIGTLISSGGTLPLSKMWRSAFTIDQLHQLISHATCINDNAPLLRTATIGVFTRFLHDSGYIVRRGEDEICIPNEEMRSLLIQHVTQYHFVQRHGFDISLLDNIETALNELINQKTESTDDLKEALEEMIRSLSENVEVAHIEHHIHLIFEISTWRVNTSKRFMGGDFTGKCKQKRPDLVMCSRNSCMVVELKYIGGLGECRRSEKTAQDALKQIATKGYLNTPAGILDMGAELKLLIALGVSAEKRADGIVVTVLMKKWNRDQKGDNKIENFVERIKSNLLRI